MRIPEDKYSSGHTDAECGAEVYGKTKEEAKKKADAYFEAYSPYGYSTRITKKGWSADNSYYFVFISRWHSCD